MREKLVWCGVALFFVAALGYGIYRCCHSRKQIEDAVINLYIKIVCEK